MEEANGVPNKAPEVITSHSTELESGMKNFQKGRNNLLEQDQLFQFPSDSRVPD